MLPKAEDKAVVVRAMFDRIAPRYELMNGVMSLGLDRSWRRRTVRALLLAPRARVLDLGCGTAQLASLAAHVGYSVIGLDLSLAMLKAAHADTPLLQGDALALPLATESLDGIVSGFALRNLPDLRVAFGEMARVLRPSGRIALLEVEPPAAGIFGLGHRMWLEGVVPKIGARLSDARAYTYLPASLAYLPSPEELAEMLRDAGFGSIARTRLSRVAQLVTATKNGQGIGLHQRELERGMPGTASREAKTDDRGETTQYDTGETR